MGRDITVGHRDPVSLSLSPLLLFHHLRVMITNMEGHYAKSRKKILVLSLFPPPLPHSMKYGEGREKEMEGRCNDPWSPWN